MSSNPLLNLKTLENVETLDSKEMTINGTVNKLFVLTGIVVLTAMYSWSLMASGYADKANMLMIGSSIAGLILALITVFKPNTSHITAPAYAICEGLLVGAVSRAYASFMDGIVVNAIGITILVLLSMLFLYKTRIIVMTERLRSVIMISTFAVFIFYLAGFIGALFGHPMTIFNGGALGIGVSLLICVIAAFNFIVDFDFIEKASEAKAPKYYEWYGAFGILVTLVWLYFEVLRLLAQLANRD